MKQPGPFQLLRRLPWYYRFDLVGFWWPWLHGRIYWLLRACRR